MHTQAPTVTLGSWWRFKWAEMSYSSNWYAVAHRRPGNTVCECTSSEHLASVWQAVHCLHFFSFLQLEAGFILQYRGATESWLLINRPTNNCWLWVRPSWARGTGSKLMPALDSFMVAWKVFTFAAKYQTYVNMTTRTFHNPQRPSQCIVPKEISAEINYWNDTATECFVKPPLPISHFLQRSPQNVWWLASFFSKNRVLS